MQKTPHVTSASHVSWAGALLLGLFVLPMAAHLAETQELDIVNPLPGAQVAAGYGPRVNPIFQERRPHDGIDLVASRGTPVLAAAAGTVTVAIAWRGLQQFPDQAAPGKNACGNDSGLYDDVANDDVYRRVIEVETFVGSDN